MPPAVGAAVVAGAIAGTAAVVTGVVATVTGALLIAAGTFVTTLIGGLANRPDSDFSFESQERRISVRGTNERKVLILGETAVGGHIELFEPSGADNQYLHIIESHAVHPSWGILGWIIDGERVGDLDAGGFALEGRFAGKVRLRGLLGAFDQQADPETVAEASSWEASDKGGGVTGTAARLEFDQNTFPQGFRSLQAIVRGMRVFDPREPQVTLLTSSPGALSVFTTDAPHGYAIGQEVWIIGHGGAEITVPEGTERWRGQWHQVKTTPQADQFTLIDQDGADLGLTTGGSGGAVSAMGWSNNWALCTRAFMCNRHTYKYRDDEVASVTADANISDEQVPLIQTSSSFTAIATSPWFAMDSRERWRHGDVVRISGTPPGGFTAGIDYFIGQSDGAVRVTLATTLENARAGIYVSASSSGAATLTRFSQLRYTVDGFVSLGDDPGATLEALKAAGAGIVTEINGLLHIIAGAAVTTTDPITDRDIIGEVEALPGLPLEVAFNAVRAAYADPDENYQTVAAPIYASTQYRLDDGGDLIIIDPALPFTDSPEAAHRLAKILTERAHQEITAGMVVKPRQLEATVWDVKPVTVDWWGWTAKEFRVASVQERPDMALILGLQEEAAAAWDYNFGEQVTGDLAPNTNLPDPFGTVPPPDNLVVTSGSADLFTRIDGTVFSRIKVAWDLATDIYVLRGGRVHVEVRPTGSADWELHQTTDGDDTLLYVLDVQDGVQYDVRARFTRQNLVESAWTQAAVHLVQGKSLPPLRPDTFTVTRNADGTRRFDWTQAIVDADVRTGGGYLIRYFIGTTSDWSAMSELHSGRLLASPFETNQLAAGDYTFAIRTIDSSENLSAEAIFIQATLGDPRLQNVLVERQDHLLQWPGVKTDCFVDGDNVLYARSLGDWSDLPDDWSALSGDWETILPNRTPIRYETETIDLGLDINFTPLVTASGSGAFTFEMQTGTSAQGAPQAPWVAVAPVLGIRYIKIRATSAGTTPRFETLTTLIDASFAEDVFEDVNTATETALWFNRIAAGHFQIGSKSGDLAAVSVARILALQNVGAGWTWELLNKSSTVNGEPAAEFKIYNGAGVLADATIDASLKGPSS